MSDVRRAAAICALAAFLAAGCASAGAVGASPGLPTSHAAAVSEATLQTFDYVKAPINAKLELREEHPDYEVYRVSFPANRRDDLLNPETVAWFYRQRDGRRRAGIVQIPILGGDYEPEKFFAEGYAHAGFNALIVERKEGLFEIAKGFAHTRQVIVDTIIDLRRWLDWWMTRPEIDAHRVGVTGISMGGMLGSLLVPLERERIAAAVLALSGGDFPEMLAVSDEGEIVALREGVRRMYGWDVAQMRDAARAALNGIDTLALAPRVDPSRVLFISPRFDQVVPFALAARWWEVAGRPQRIVIPTGHYSSAFFAYYLHRKCVEHFRRQFGYRG